MRSLTQNEREQYSHILRFKESFYEFPEGILCFDDNPDVLVKTSESMLGIEHTRLYWGNLKEQESLEQRIVDLAKASSHRLSHYEVRSQFPLQAD